MTPEEREWSPAERAALRDLPKGSPPPDLEDDVVAALAARGLAGSGAPTGQRPSPSVGARAGWPRGTPWLLAAAAAVAVFVAGWAAGGSGGSHVPEGKRYMLLFYESTDFDLPEEPAEYTELIERYVGWADSLRNEGIRVVGDELMPEGLVLASEEAAAGRPGLEEAEYLGGYMILEAPDAETAAVIARTHPHLEYGGTVVVRPIVEME